MAGEEQKGEGEKDDSGVRASENEKTGYDDVRYRAKRLPVSWDWDPLAWNPSE